MSTVRLILPLVIVTALAAPACDRRSEVRESAKQGAGPATADPSRRSAGSAKADIALAADATIVAATVAPGQTLASILRAHDVAAADIAAIVQRAGALFDLRKVRADQPYRFAKTPQGSVKRLDYEIDGDRFLHVVRSGGEALVATVEPIPKTRRVEVVRGRIDRHHPSLVAALDEAGETIDLTLALAAIFGGDIDFATELQPGDHVELTVEKQFRDEDQFAGYGPILAAEFTNAGRRVRAVRFTPEGGAPGYYDEHGVSMRRFFLASPLKFQPLVTSAFSRSRLHPILREYRAHLGVDYKAPAGAPVVAVADGVVVSAGTSGGSGRMVHLRHPNGYETEYLHLSAIAVRKGAHVRQGELVGRVGSTGLATGPHLDYRLKKNGSFVNPIAAHRSMPASEPIPAAQKVAFTSARDRAMAVLSTSAVARVANRNGVVQ